MSNFKDEIKGNHLKKKKKYKGKYKYQNIELKVGMAQKVGQWAGWLVRSLLSALIDL